MTASEELLLYRPGTNSVLTRFEKSLYDLIKGLRSHKGGEDEYIQNSLRECKAEIKSQDMDRKATALLKLIYLEMFGYDMSWAAFNVLEVMSSAKYLQKRVGYLGAVQSFRPDTEVLMLATNMLKKDIVSPNIPSLSLPLATLPHILTPSLSMSLLPDILSRLSHSSAVVRKKTIVCLYRISLVYPEALKLAWPRIKDHLMDEQEDSSVTTAAINVVCELGWRRPHDFLPLAPRLFELLVDSGNNWMAIKIIKLFATLTPLEPRLTRKLLRPLTNIIQTTTAMSLLYECINGIIQGGILDGEDNLQERDEVASLCVGKLRGMIVMDSDPNLKYVALLALNRIVTTHPMLVSMQQDVIMECLDDADISIRLQALELAAGMVTSDTLLTVVNRLVEQLRFVSTSSPKELFVPEAEDFENRKVSHVEAEATMILPNDYRTEVVHRILDICAQNNYSEITDFEWYVGILVQLVGLLPPLEMDDYWYQSNTTQETVFGSKTTVAFRIGAEIRNIAVRVKGVRLEACQAAESLLLVDNRPILFPVGSSVGEDVLGPISWVVGEYAEYLRSPARSLHSLIDPGNIALPPKTLQLFLQAIPKVFVQAIRACESKDSWKSEISLLLARIVEFLESLAAHPDLDVQERAIEFLEVLRLGSDALRSEACEVPFLLTSVIPSLFGGLELNPVAFTAQKKVVLPPSLRLGEAFNDDLPGLFHCLDSSLSDTDQHSTLQDFYYIQDPSPPTNKPVYDPTGAGGYLDISYQNTLGEIPNDSAGDKPRSERRERYRDDPFYIAPIGVPPGVSAPSHGFLGPSSGEIFDIDTIPIVDLKLEDGQKGDVRGEPPGTRRHQPRKLEVAGDETFGVEDPPVRDSLLGNCGVHTGNKRSQSRGFNPGGNGEGDAVSPGDEGDIEMKKAMQDVEQVRLRMQRASERIHLEGTPAEGTLVKKKKSKKKHVATRASHSDATSKGGEHLEAKKKRKKIHRHETPEIA
ncbi:hypothetical protein N7532_010389 [Penicillium argentinense]|uniref:AP-3 complex subunit delta n=1 Tax=Penicillium argentinense TaxID=1131581 RepID=A0A9W9JXW6_9EURO|nr:uncharacterized protein N7532_010389 [Penicillium argentinense]KAJ5085618.1 hypothetical protein N7532_010389 [Penicillium argentinense]